MSHRLPTGPYRTLKFSDSAELPYYIIPFDKRGLCQGPETRTHLLDTLKNGSYSDVYLFSHGWNNDWTVATKRYEDFIDGFSKLRTESAVATQKHYKPLLIGIFWPSTFLVFGGKEKGPEFAATDIHTCSVTDEAIAAERREIAELSEALTPEQARVLYQLSQKDSLEEDEARELAKLALEFVNVEDDETGTLERMDVDDVLGAWLAAEVDNDELEGLISGASPRTAGIGSFVKKLDPRNALRTLTVYQMKDRAGTVGAKGVSPLLREILLSTDSRVHMIGHSYGGKVVLSAISCGVDLPRKAYSMLLLQPAVSHLCFAESVPGTHPTRSGGYRPALTRVERPILSTYSANDVSLTKFFHLALRRKGDLGEEKIAAAAGEPPGKFAALGGFGPRNSGQKLIQILDPGQPYSFLKEIPIYGIDGTRTIAGHGDISNPSTWWALHTLTTA